MPRIKTLKDIRAVKQRERARFRWNQSGKYYNSSAWQTLRKAYLMEHPLCEECLEHQIVTPAEHVHHKTEFLTGKTDAERYELLLDWYNLQALCPKCHMEKHKHKRMKE